MAKEEPGAWQIAQPAGPVKVEIYTERFGASSIRAKGLLDRKGVSYSEYAIDLDATNKGDMIKRSRGRREAPQIFIDNRPLGGWDELMDLERRGVLDRLLGVESGGSQA